nr:GNAT family N-acetyltransferase [Clostridia bacterium]
MQVIHPAEPWQNIHPDDIFDVVNDQGLRCGRGHVVYQHLPAIYPDKPVNIYFTMECTPEAEYMLYGALVARARQLRQMNPNEAAHIYTSVDPRDTRLLNFCLYNGLAVSNSEDVVRLQVPADGGPDTFNCTFEHVPLNTPQEQSAFIARLHANSLTHITPEYLMALKANPVCVALGLFYGRDLAGECIISGAPGKEPELVAIYVNAPYRGNGMGKRLLRRALSFCALSGVSTVQARIMSASQPQSRLMRGFGAETLEQTLLFPGTDL